MVEDIIAVNGTVAYLSTPSIYFSVPEEHQKKSYCFDFDKKWVSVFFMTLFMI